jgi:O-antigen ligase
MASMTPSLPIAWPAADTLKRQDALPLWARPVLLLFAAYLAVPALEVPLFGLSLSAPLFCFVALDCLLRPVAWHPYRKWIGLAVLFWVAHLFSLTANVLLGNLAAIRGEQVCLLARFAYWMLVFVVTAMLVHRSGLGASLARALAAGVFALGLLRLAEAAVFGYWGEGNPQFLSQNDYGFGFSAFTPFATWLAVESRGWRRLLVVAGWLSLLVAVIGNGSRSSWITVALGLVLICLLAGLARSRREAAASAVFVLLAPLPAGVLWMAPSWLRDPVVERGATLGRLDRDKPFQARQLLIRKGIALFRQNPLFGVGVGGFTQTLVPLEIPSALHYRSVEEFNRKTPHNSYVKVLAETGLFGAASLSAVLALLAWQGLPATLARARRGETWAIPVFVGFLMMCVHFWTLSGLTGTAHWFLCGMLAGVIERNRACGCAGDRDPRLIRPFAASLGA